MAYCRYNSVRWDSHVRSLYFIFFRLLDALITYEALLLHDSRLTEEDAGEFLNLMEDYFAQPEEILKRDELPD